MRSEGSEQHQQAAKQALQDHCEPLLSGTASLAAPLGRPPQLQLLPLVKPCAWPFPVTGSHFADTATMTVLARDAALWEGFCAGLAAGYGDEQQHAVLRLLWKAAACFAERASSGDRTQRQLWSALTAARMQVSRVLHHNSAAQASSSSPDQKPCWLAVQNYMPNCRLIIASCCCHGRPNSVLNHDWSDVTSLRTALRARLVAISSELGSAFGKKLGW